MKLRNIILAAVAVTACSSAFAADTGAMAQGGTYVGLAAGWGSLSQDQTTTDLTSSETGGFSGRVYLGYLMSVNTASSWMFGPELGYSYYANNTYTASSANYKQSGYGVDMLLNATYMFNSAFNIAVKPGFQYGFEKLTYSSSSTSGSTTDNRVLPEVNVGANWQVFADKPFFLGASYQYVWGDNGNDNVTTDRNVSVTSRDMFALNLEYMFH